MSLGPSVLDRSMGLGANLCALGDMCAWSQHCEARWEHCSGNVAFPINTNPENHHLYLGLFQGWTVRILSLIN